MEITVFYAWQDDRPGKCNRHLIREAAVEACQRITNDPANDFVVRLDQDTKGVPGMCDIPNAILEEITNCDVFLADLTFVGATDQGANHRKQIANANVLMELGYAVGRKASDELDGFEQVIGVMNEAYGAPGEQAFDIKRRHAIRYTLPEGSENADVRRQKDTLSREIEKALSTILENVAKAEKHKTEDRAEAAFYDVRREFESSVRDGTFHGLLKDSAAVTLCLVPDVPARLQQSQLGRLNIIPLRLTRPEDYGRELAGDSVAFFCESVPEDRPESPPARLSIVEVTSAGTILAADTLLLSQPAGNAEDIVCQKDLETLVSHALVRCVTALHELGIHPPWRLAISLMGVRGYRMSLGGPVGPPWHDGDTLCADPVPIGRFDEVSNEQAARQLLKGTFDYFAREFGVPRF